jgi:hypothetical protein
MGSCVGGTHVAMGVLFGISSSIQGQLLHQLKEYIPCGIIVGS